MKNVEEQAQPKAAVSLKRIFDVAAASAALVVTAPAMATAIALAYIDHGGVFFRQERLGLRGKPFHILKIKSMRDSFDAAGRQLPNRQRISAIGSFLRRSKFDELPQLINVLKGDMSIIGPRPLEARHDMAHDKRRQSVRPGMSGLAQLQGRTNVESLADDIAYVEESAKKTQAGRVIYDLGIVLKTIPAIARQFRQ